MNKHFTKEDAGLDGNQHMKRSSTSFVIRKMHVNATISYHYRSIGLWLGNGHVYFFLIYSGYFKDLFMLQTYQLAPFKYNQFIVCQLKSLENHKVFYGWG